MSEEYRIDRRDNGAGFPVAYLIDQRGVIRRASDAEAWLWDRLQEAREQLAQPQQDEQPRKGRR